jgi:hypothetical protein
MKLLEDLTNAANNVDSPFQSQLIREDIARLNKLNDLAGSSATFEDFRKEGFYIGWTRDDLRTMEMAETLDRLLAAFYRIATCENSPTAEQELIQAWSSFNRDRMEKLIGCL